MKNYLCCILLLSVFFVCETTASDRLTATIIGSGSPKYNETRAGASVLISAGETQILVDMGNGTQANLNRINIDTRKISALFFTHHHLDHNEEFIPILIRSLMGRHNFKIIGPPNTKKLTESTLDLYAEDIGYRLGKTKRRLEDRRSAFTVKDIMGGEVLPIGGIRVSTLKVPHTIHTIAYRFDYNGDSVVVTGDLTLATDLPQFAQNADFMIIDSGGMIMKNGKQTRNRRKGNRKTIGSNQFIEKTKRRNGSRTRAHLSLNDSSLLARKANVKALVYTHFTAGEIDEEASLKEIRKNYSGKVIFGKDLMALKKFSRQKSKGLKKNNGGYPIVDTGQKSAYSSDRKIKMPSKGQSFFGQDACYSGNQPTYTDNNDGTITDNVTGLIWQKDMDEKMSYKEAVETVKKFRLAGYNDWRIPTVKELYSLIQFTGKAMGQRVIKPFIDTTFFIQPSGDTGKGERQIDAQTWTSTEYVGKTMRNDTTVFGVNFVDGRIKGYPRYNPRSRKANRMYFRFVRGNTAYGKNSFVDNGNGTITDSGTGLMWQESDSRKGFDWKESLNYAEKLKLGGYDDWRLPNAKELQSIVDYTRSPQTTGTAAINPVFKISEIRDPQGKKQFPYFWTGTTHLDGRTPYNSAVYIAFGEAQGKMRNRLMDVHGAGAQRSDPKTGIKQNYPQAFGPQGDIRYVFNYVRCVRTTGKDKTNNIEAR